MKRNFISIGKLGDSSCLSTSWETWWNITKESLVIAKGDRIGTLYLCPHNTDYSISVASIEIGAALWHHRLGYMREKGMQILHSRKLLPDLKQVSLEFCENCVYGKHKRVRFLRVGQQKKSEKCNQEYFTFCGQKLFLWSEWFRSRTNEWTTKDEDHPWMLLR